MKGFAIFCVILILSPAMVFAGDELIVAKEVVVTATKAEIPIEEAPGAITIITREEIEDKAPRDILDVIRETTGISLIGRSVGGRKSISIRGLDSRHTLLLVDGKRIAASTAIFGHSNFENNWIATENIERIEIVRGPLSALYGSEAIGGVVNIITKPISKKDWTFGTKIGGGVLDDTGGNNIDVSAYASGPLVQDRWGLYLAAGYNRDDDTPSEDNPKLSELEGIKTYSFSSKVAFTPNNNHTLELAVELVDEERWEDGMSAGRTPRLHRLATTLDKSMYSLSWNGVLGLTQSSVKLYRSVIFKETSRDYGQGATEHYPEELTNDVLDAQTSFVLGRHLFTLGGELRREDLESTTLISGQDEATHLAIFIQDEIEFFDKLCITLGSRLDHHDKFGSEFSPRIYGLYQVTEQLSLKAGYGQAFNAPTLKQVSEGYHAAFGPHTFLGNPDVGPETSDNYELGLEYVNRTFQAKFFCFYNDIDDMIDWKEVDRTFGPRPRVTYKAENLEKVRTRGVEAEIGVRLDSGLALSTNYTYLDAIDLEENERLTGKPRHTLNARLSYTLSKFGLTATLHYQFIGDQVLWGGTRRNPVLEDVPDYSLWHFVLRKKVFDNFEIKAGIENIGDVRLADKSDLFAYEERGRFFHAWVTAKF